MTDDSPLDRFRTEVAGWLADHYPAALRDPGADARAAADAERDWQRLRAARGWLAPTWPIEYGGAGLDPERARVLAREFRRIGVRPPPISAGLSLLGPVLFERGTPEQKQRHLPGIARDAVMWCQGYSEPGAGSDLAGLGTRAVLDGDHYVVDGQKIWTSHADRADWMFCLVRTDPKADKHEGIGFLLIDMKSPGITVRPIVLLDGSKEVNEVFFDEVRVPAENLVHEEGKGWTVAKYLLGYERMGTGRIGASKRELAKLKELAGEQMKDGRPIIEDPRFRDRLTRVEVELMALEITNLRFLDQMRRSGRPPGADVSMLKIKGTEIQQAITELMMQAAGPLAQAFRPVDAMDFDHFTARLAPRYCNLRKATIYAGSNEIQRNIIAKATLGL